MARLSKKPLYWALACLTGLGAGSQTLAEDTEIYFSQAALEGTAIVRANVMFVLDTSGSMREEVGTTGKSRLQVMQEALNVVLDNASGVNVGLMRFHEQGGPVLFPVSNIDSAVGGIEGVKAQVSAGEDDGSEVVTSSSSSYREVDISSKVLTLGEDSGFYDTLELQISNNNDDVEEGGSDASKNNNRGDVMRNGKNLEMVSSGNRGNQTIGLRFRNVEVPRDAHIENAYLEFVVRETNKNASGQLWIAGEDIGDAPAFSSTDNDVSRRSRTPSVTWSNIPAPNKKQKFTSPDLSSIVNQIVERGDWDSGNDMVFMITGNGRRDAYTRESDTNRAAKLFVTFCDDCESKNQLVAVRFRGVDVPKGATINSATIEFTGQASGETGDASFRIVGEVSPSAAALEAVDANLTGRTLTSAGVDWAGVAPWNSPGEVHQTPDLSSIVEEVVAGDGWCAGQDMVFLFSGTGTRTAWSFDGNSAEAPRITVDYDAASVSADACGAGGQTVRSRLKETVNDLTHSGWTPIVSTLYEAGRYFRGEEVFFGRTRGDGPTYNYSFEDNHNNPQTHADSSVSHPTSYTGGSVFLPAGCASSNSSDAACLGEEIRGTPVYRSPMEESCQGNYIVLLSDGYPTRHYAENLLESGWVGTACAATDDGACGPELTEFLRTVDQDTNVKGDQFVETYTIGFNVEGSGASYLKSLVDDSTDQYFDASSAADVVKAFSTILSEIRSNDNTFVAPSASVNAFNRLTHRDEVYFALFEPSTSARWTGNLKRYRLKGGTSAGIYDANDKPAIDAATSLFDNDAQSFWSAGKDGNNVGEGGAADELTTTRNLYTYPGAYNGLGSNGVNLNEGTGAYDISETNTANVTKALLNIPSATDGYHQELLKWARGVVEVDDGTGTLVDKPRKWMGDALHSEPVLVTYGGTASNPDITVFMSTNEGYLHAFNATNGSEQFGFMPKELLRNLNVLYQNTHAADKRPYGMDGALAAWVYDKDKDGAIEPSDGDFVYLYASMRRGGRNLFMLDVTDRANPKLKWVIEGGSGDFAALGETWSQPRLATIQYAGSPRKVLIFGGGYDSDQDSAVTRRADSMGDAVYIVDAATGQRLWWASSDSSADLSLAGMTNAIPAEIRVIDVNDNGLSDRLYFGDMGGRVWRVDLDETHATAGASLALGGGVFADLNGGDAAGNRRFYYPPDVAKIKRSGGYLSVAIGSGYRAHPLNQTIEDRFYVLQDKDVYTRPDFTNAGYAPIGESDLYDTTSNAISEEVDATKRAAAKAALAAKSGWYIVMEGAGEKVLAESITFDHKILFSTFTPVPPTGNTQLCSVATSNAKLYAVSVLDGTPITELDGVNPGGLLTKGDRVYQLASAGIAPEPKLFFIVSDSGQSGNNGQTGSTVKLPEEVLVLVGREHVPITFPLTLTKTYWREN